MTGPRRTARRLSTGCALLGSTALLVGCGGGDARPAPPDAHAYVAVVEHFLPPAADPEALPVVYVVSLGDEPLSLDDQVVVIDELAESGDVRFADDVDAVLDPGADGAPPRDEGLLIGIGAISSDRPHVVRVEVYRDDDSVAAHLVTVAARRSTWVVVDDEAVEPEVLDVDG